MTEETISEQKSLLKKHSTFAIVTGIVLVVLGIFAMGSPLFTGVAVAIMVGILMVFSGITRTVFSFGAPTLASGILGVVIGLLTIVAGIVVLAHPLLGLATLTLVLAAYFLIDGVFEIGYAFQLKPTKGWAWTLFSGVVTLLLALMIWLQWPLSGAWAIGLLVGIQIFFAGWSMFGLGAAARTWAK